MVGEVNGTGWRSERDGVAKEGRKGECSTSDLRVRNGHKEDRSERTRS